MLLAFQGAYLSINRQINTQKYMVILSGLSKGFSPEMFSICHARILRDLLFISSHKHK